MKKPLASKTIWLNLATAILALFVPPAAQWIGDHPTEALTLLALANTAVRFITKEEISLY